jgi:hypothetical protein
MPCASIPRWMPPQTRAALNTGRAADVVKLAAEKSGWGPPLPAGRYAFICSIHPTMVGTLLVDPLISRSDRRLTSLR